MFYRLVELLNSIKLFPYYFISPLIYSYGNTAEQVFLTSGENILKNKKIIILNYGYLSKFLKVEIANKSLINEIVINGQIQKNKKYFIILLEWCVFIEFFFRRILIIFFKDKMQIKTNELDRFPYLGLKKLYSFNKRHNKYDEVTKLSLNQSKISLNEETISYCSKHLKNLDLIGKKIVCLHVRDSNYKNDSSKRNYRNSNIDNYRELINFYIKNDFIVVRLGQRGCNKINFSHQKFIDYPFSNFQSPLMDIYLIFISDLFIGTSSGPRSVAEMFAKPILITNLDDLSDFPIKNCDRTLFKKIYKKDDKTLLDITRLDELDYNLFDPELILDDFILEENSSKDLYEAGKEFLYNFNQNSYSLNRNQLEFNRNLGKGFKNFYTENNKGKLKFHIDSLKYVKRLKTMQGSICNYQLNLKI